MKIISFVKVVSLLSWSFVAIGTVGNMDVEAEGIRTFSTHTYNMNYFALFALGLLFVISRFLEIFLIFFRLKTGYEPVQIVRLFFFMVTEKLLNKFGIRNKKIERKIMSMRHYMNSTLSKRYVRRKAYKYALKHKSIYAAIFKN